MVELNLSKRGQITIFIILGIALAIVLILLFVNQNNLFSIFLGKTPLNQVTECIEDSTKEALSLIISQGGSIEPELYFPYKDNKLQYTCYTEESFQKCVNQKPLLKQSVEKELATYIQPKLSNCLRSLKLSLEKRNNIITYKEPIIQAKLFPEDIQINVEIDLTITKDDQTINHKSLKTDIDSNLYDFIILTSSITNDEAEYGDSDTTGYMFKDKSIKIEKLKQGDETTVYILTDRQRDETFMFATRSIPIPPGWVGVTNFK